MPWWYIGVLCLSAFGTGWAFGYDHGMAKMKRIYYRATGVNIDV